MSVYEKLNEVESLGGFSADEVLCRLSESDRHLTRTANSSLKGVDTASVAAVMRYLGINPI